MKPLSNITLYIIILLIITWICKLYIFKNIHVMLIFWAVSGIAVIVLVSYIIRHRYEMTPYVTSYWDNDSYSLLDTSVWIDGYREYMTQLDNRYFNPRSNVYYMELVNLLFTIGVILAIVMKNMLVLKICLLGQILVTIYYLITIPKNLTRLIEYIYFGISSIWLVYPMILLSILSE